MRPPLQISFQGIAQSDWLAICILVHFTAEMGGIGSVSQAYHVVKHPSESEPLETGG